MGNPSPVFLSSNVDSQLHESKTITKRNALGAVFTLGLGLAAALLFQSVRALAPASDLASGPISIKIEAGFGFKAPLAVIGLRQHPIMMLALSQRMY